MHLSYLARKELEAYRARRKKEARKAFWKSILNW